MIGATSGPDNLNELLSGGGKSTDDVLDLLFLQLLEEQPDYTEHPPTFSPSLARSYHWSEDHKILTIILRDDVVWSDGQPVTAEDVRWTWQAQTDPQVAWNYGFVKQSIEDVEVASPHEVRFHFSEVYSYQLVDVNEGYILPKHAWEQLPFSEWRRQGGWFRDHMVSSGPYVLKSWQPLEEVVVERNPRYHEPGLPYLDRVVFRIIPDQSSQLTELLAGTIDYVEAIPPSQVPRVEAAPDVQLLNFPSRQFNYVCWNTSRPLFSDPDVRRALTLAINRQEIIDTLWYGYARVASSPIISTVWAHNRALEPWPYDPEAARRILERKGWRDSDGDGILDRGGTEFSFLLTTNTGNQIRIDAVVMIQEQLRRLGIEVRPQLLEFNTLISRTLEHEFDALLGGYLIDTTLDLTYAFHSGSEDNIGLYSSPEVDRLIEEARLQAEPEAARPMLLRLQEILHTEQPYTFLWEPRRLNAARSRARDIQSNALSSYFRLREWWIIPAG